MSDLPPIVRPENGAPAVDFDHALAADLAGELRAAASALDEGVADRATAAAGARTHWRGINRGEFDDAVGDQASTATGLADRCARERGRLLDAWESANAEQRRRNEAAADEAPAGGGGGGQPAHAQ